MTAKQFLEKVRQLGVHPKLSPDKTFVIYEPSLSVDLIQQAIDLTDDICILLDAEDILLSNNDRNLIESFIDNDDDTKHSSFKLTDPSSREDVNVIVYEDMTPESFDRDFDFIRGNLKSIITSGTKALNRMILVAEESQHPRAYEVVATLLKAVADINKDLLKSHREKFDQDKESGSNNINKTTNIQNNTVFVGSTSELAKMLKNKTLDN